MSSADMIENYKHIIDDVNDFALAEKTPIVQALPYGEFIPEELADANKVMANFEHIRSQVNDRASSPTQPIVGPFPHNLQNGQVNDAIQVNENFEHLVTEINANAISLDGYFVAVASGHALISEDGSSWSEVALPTTGRYVAADPNGNIVASSTSQINYNRSVDSGVSWGSVNYAPAPSSTLNNLIYAGGLFLQPEGPGNRIMISSDGSNFTEHNMFGQDWIPIWYDGTTYWSITGQGANQTYTSSPDGTTWTWTNSPVVPATAFDRFNTAWSGTTAVVVGAPGIVTATNECLEGPDPTNLTIRTMPTSSPWSDVAYGNGVFVAVSYGTDQAATSPDGITWTARTLPSVREWNAIIFNGSTFAAISGDGITSAVVATSTDGIAWTEVTTGVTNRNWFHIASSFAEFPS
jgi:hypothetical protein